MADKRTGKRDDRHRTQRATSQQDSKSSAPHAAADPLRQWQHRLGNKAFGDLLIQRQMTVGEPDDDYEREADRVADQIMRQPEEEEEEELLQASPITDIARQAAPEEEEEPLQAKPDAGRAWGMTPGVETRIKAQQGQGQPLSGGTQGFFERRFGVDLSGVRVHTGGEADALNRALAARAFTTGSDIFFRRGEYDANSTEGRHLLAHELTHVVQQKGAEIQRQGGQERALADTTSVAYLGLLPARLNDVNARYQKLTEYAQLGMDVATLARDRLLTVSGRYRQAYNTYAGVIAQAEAEARNQEAWWSICIGVAVGAALGALAAFAFPATAAVAFDITVTEALSAAGISALTGVVGAPITAAITPEVAGSDLDPGGLSPDVLERDIWHGIADLYRRSASVVPIAAQLHQLTLAISSTIGDIRVLQAGGETEANNTELFDRARTLNRAAIDTGQYDDMIETNLNGLRAARERLQSLSLAEYSVEQLERMIWILWIDSLPISEHNILDLDAIEDHLLAIGVLGPNSGENGLGVDFGGYTTTDDEYDAMIAAARVAGGYRADLAEAQTSVQPEGGE